MIQLSGLDGLFVNLEMRGLPMHISSFSIYDPATAGADGVTFEMIRQSFKDSVDSRVPALKNLLYTVPMGLDQPYWVEDKNFSIDLHVHRIALPAPGDWSTLCEVLANMHAAPLCRDKPLWEAWVIENLDSIDCCPKASFGIFLKVHHALMDGRTGLKIFTSLHSLNANEAPMAIAHPAAMDNHDAEAETLRSYQRPSAFSMMGRSTVNNCTKTFGLIGLATKRIPRAYSAIREAISEDEIRTIQKKEKTCFNDVISQSRVLNRIRVPMAAMKAIRGCVPGSTLNDVAMTIISGGLRSYLQAVETLPESSMVATVPIDVRARKDADKMGNMLNIMNVSLASDIEDSLERLRQVKVESQYAKKFSRKMGKQLLTRILDNIYPALLAWGMPPFINSSVFSKLPVVANTVITNVPGAKVPLFFSGARLVESFGLGPLIPNTSLFHTITSTCDWLSISFVSCPQAMKNPDLYQQSLLASYNDLAAKAGVSKVVPLADNSRPKPVYSLSKKFGEQVVNG